MQPRHQYYQKGRHLEKKPLNKLSAPTKISFEELMLFQIQYSFVLFQRFVNNDIKIVESPKVKTNFIKNFQLHNHASL